MTETDSAGIKALIIVRLHWPNDLKVRDRAQKKMWVCTGKQRPRQRDNAVIKITTKMVVLADRSADPFEGNGQTVFTGSDLACTFTEHSCVYWHYWIHGFQKGSSKMKKKS